MKIALVAPPYPLEEAPSPPLGICYVAAACEKAGAEVKIFDYIVSRYTPEKLKAQLDSFQPDIIGATSVTMNFPTAAGILQDAKRCNPSLITMMGGPHVSFDYKKTLFQYPEIDLIVIGEAEQTLMELIPALKKRHKWKEIRGIAYLERDCVIETGQRAFIQELDSLPLPARHLLSLSRYKALGYSVSIITSRGCPNGCIFCQGRRMVGRKVRYRNPGLVVDEIEQLLSYGLNPINVADDLFTANKKHVLAICNEIEKRRMNVVWSAFSRVNTVDLDTLQAMKNAGCHAVSFGIESGNPEMLKRIRKGITLDQARQAVALCKKVGMRTHASFMVGLPGESLQTMQDSERFAEELDIEYGYHFLAPFPGTTLKEEIENYDLEILTDDWTRYDANSAIVRTSNLRPEEIDAFVADCYQKHEKYRHDVMARYEQGRCDSEELKTIEGYYCCIIVFKLLSEDLVETHGCFTLLKDDPVQEFLERLVPVIGLDESLVRLALKTLLDNEHLGYHQDQDAVRWFWTNEA